MLFRILLAPLLAAVSSGAITDGIVDRKGGENDVPADVLFACTSCLDCSNINFFHLVRGLRSVLVAERNSSDVWRIMEVLVVNEVRPPGAPLYSWAAALGKLLPTVRFFQKDGISQKGQAFSLNYIVRTLVGRKAKYWLHWEESWQADAPFLARAITVMEASRALQVELASTEEMEQFLSPAVLPGEGRLLETPASMRECNWSRVWGKGGFDRRYWPLFTLHPSLWNVEDVAAAGPFTEDPAEWPVGFEFKWACPLVRGGARKSVLLPPVVTRQSGHKSSYQRLGNLRRLGICAVLDPEYPHCSQN